MSSSGEACINRNSPPLACHVNDGTCQTPWERRNTCPGLVQEVAKGDVRQLCRLLSSGVAPAKPKRGPRLPAPRQPYTWQAHAEHTAMINVCMVIVPPRKFWLNMLQRSGSHTPRTQRDPCPGLVQDVAKGHVCQLCRFLGSNATPVKPKMAMSAVPTPAGHLARSCQTHCYD